MTYKGRDPELLFTVPPSLCKANTYRLATTMFYDHKGHRILLDAYDLQPGWSITESIPLLYIEKFSDINNNTFCKLLREEKSKYPLLNWCQIESKMAIELVCAQSPESYKPIIDMCLFLQEAYRILDKHISHEEH